MEEKKSNDPMKLLGAMLGAEGAQTIGMIERMTRLQRLMGPKEGAEPVTVEARESGAPPSPFGTTQGENILFAAIPFLDQEYQRDIFVVVRLMEMRRVMESSRLEVREKQEDPVFRRHKMLGAVKTYLPQEDRSRLDQMIKMMEMKEIFERREGN